MRIETYQVDAFTGVPFSGNPAAVCLLPSECQPLDDTTRQAIAAEMNLSETAFIEPVVGTEASVSRNTQAPFRSQQRFRLRWFTPTAEVPLCGHATLAAAYVLFAEKANIHERLEFETLSGVLAVERGAQGGTPVLQMDLPLKPPSDPLPAPLQAAGGAAGAVEGEASGGALQQLLAACIGQLPVAAVQFNADLKYLLVVLKEEDGALSLLQQLSPDARGLLGAISGKDVSGVIVTCRGDGKQYDFHSRFFGPWLGVPEDPVTGSAHSVLAAYWSARLDSSSMRARQCSPRGGDVWVDMGTSPGRVTVAGQGVVVLRGELQL